jgi:lipoprotein-anchoring transpeptidase ErfK/SrfK
MAVKTKQTPKPPRHTAPKAATPPRRKHLWPAVIIAVILAALVAPVGWGWWFYGSHALPGISVGSIDVSQADAGQIRQAIAREQALMTASINAGGKLITVPLSQLGVTVDVNATIGRVLQARRTGDLLQNLQPWHTIAVPLALNNDWGLLKVYIKQHYPSLFVDATNAQLSYDPGAKQFTITPGTPGKGFAITEFEQSLPGIALHPGAITLHLTTAPVEPLVSAKGLAATQQAINKRLQIPIRFLFNGALAAQPSASDIANWAYFTPDATTGTASWAFDKAKIQQFITDKVASRIARVPIDRKIVVDEQTGAQDILSVGQSGQEVTDADKVTVAVYNALTNNQPLDQPLSVQDAPFKTVTLAGTGKWIEVDVSKETATMYIGTTPVKSFLISSGKAGTPTEIGTFHVYSKTPEMTMTGTVAGEYFYLPNIKWVSFFDGGEAFHGTYWHHNFGHPMSHGCINMTEADAKILYDFAPVGTKVVVHA